MASQRTKLAKPSMTSSSDVPKKASTRAGVKQLVAQVRANSAARNARKGGSIGPFSGVSMVSGAPVSIGNLIRSVTPSVVSTRTGVVITGRDYVMEIGGIASANLNWQFTGGFPLTPAALSTSALRGYFSSYQRFRVLKAVAHYITSSPTSTAGDVLILHHHNHAGPKVNFTSANFLSYCLSTPNAVLSNQWTNFSVPITCSTEYLNTDIFNSEDVQHQSDGEILVYSKGTTNGIAADSPGYLLIDYSIEFDMLMVNPRVLSLPTSLMKWYNIGLGTGVVSPAAKSPLILNANVNSTPDFNVHPVPAGDAAGLIYQVVLDLTVASNPNALNLSNEFLVKIDDTAGPNAIPFALTSGTTLYGVSGILPFMELYPNYDSALAGRPLIWNSAHVNVSLNLGCAISLVGSVNQVFSQANIG